MHSANLLLSALKANALFSIVCAVLMVIGAGWVTAQLGLGDVLSVYITAGFLAVFSLQLWNIVRTRQIRAAEILGIIGGDIAWVIGSVVLTAIFYESLSVAGLIIVDLVALAVLIMAVLQIRGLLVFRRGVAV